MIDLKGLPIPKDAPEKGACVRVERPENGLAVIVLDPPHKKLAVLDLPLMRDLDKALDQVEADAGIRGLVITGRDPLSFAAGADIDAIASITEPALVERVIRLGHRIFGRIAALDALTVAAVGGPVPGGAYELSLACDRIVLADHPSTRIGLPETKLGILPGWGGSQRLPRRIGPAAALDAILGGKLYPARPAFKRGMVDRLTHPEYLMRIATDIALGRKKCKKRIRKGLSAVLVDRNPLATRTMAGMAKKQIMAKTRGHYPAVLVAADIVARAAHTSMKSGLDAEAKAVAELAVGDVCKNLIGIFHMSEQAKKLKNMPDGSPARRLEQAGILGAGVMGGGIASLMAEKGLETRLFDIAPPALDDAVLEHRGSIEKKRKRKRLQRHEAMAAVDRFNVSRELRGFGTCDVIVEAVAEKLDIKRAVFNELATQVGEDTVLATNTSSLSVDEIAETLPRPDRVCGMHFFNPVSKMPLVEVVRGQHTSQETLRAVTALALRIGKTPVIVKDCAGFIVNRLLGPYLDEALCLFAAGVDPERVERVALDFGMPMGPLALLDEVGFDIASHAADSLSKAYGERMTPSSALRPLMDADRLGKKNGKGFYFHPKGGKKAKPALDEGLSRFVTNPSSAAQSLSDADLVDRMILVMINEAAHAMSEGIVETGSELDLATVFGMGFPPFRGGLLKYADKLGAKQVVERLERVRGSVDVSERPGGTARFEPASLLLDMQKTEASWHPKAG